MHSPVMAGHLLATALLLDAHITCSLCVFSCSYGEVVVLSNWFEGRPLGLERIAGLVMGKIQLRL